MPPKLAVQVVALLTLFYFVSFVPFVDSSRILAVIPTASYSHQVFFRPLWKELASRGHEIVLVTTDPMRDATIHNLTEIDISVTYEYQKTAKIEDIVKGSKINGIRTMYEIGLAMTELFLSHPEVKQLFTNPNEHFDLLMLESVLMGVRSFKHRFPTTPLIFLCSLDANPEVHDWMGNPTHMIQYPSYMLPFGEGMNFMGRLVTNAIVRFSRAYIYYVIVPRLDALVARILEQDFPSMAEEVPVDMLFTNSNPLFNAVKPYAPATISIAGGLHELPKAELPSDLATFLNAATEGVVYFSLGSNVKVRNLSPETLQVILETFRRLPHKVLWKIDDDNLHNLQLQAMLPGNVKISKWIPQQDVLRHGNVKVFITQGGLQSLEESFYSGVPVVVMPYFADQEANAKRVMKRGLGLEVSHRTLTVEEFSAAILQVANDDGYRERVKAAADLIKDEPMKPLEKAVWWTEYVLRHNGAQHLKGPKLPTWQLFYLDVFGFIAGVFLVLICIVLLCCKLCCLVKRKTKRKTE